MSPVRTPLGLALALVLVVCGAASLSAQRAPDPIVVARVVDVALAPRCGDTHLAVLARHEVISVERGSINPGPLYAYYDCGSVATPGVGTFAAAPGVVLRLELSPRAPTSFGGTSGVPPSGTTAYFAVRGRPPT